MKPYPDLSKERIEDRLAKKMKKRQAAALSLVNKNEIQKDQLVNASEKKMQTKTLRKKRKSKKKRMHEKQSKIA